MNILEKIVSVKQKEVSRNRVIRPIKELEKSLFFKRNIFSLVKRLKDSKTGIIAEFKSKSPSKGVINNFVSVEKVAKDYESSGVCGISILTDQNFFSGKNEDLEKSRSIVSIPILRKDFIIDEYQIIESKSVGADVILLIASILSKNQIKNFSKLAKSIDLETIIEIHNEFEIDKITENLDIIGINNRNLQTFIVDYNNCLKLSSKIPNNYTKIAESGINDVNHIFELRKQGFKGFLIGEYFMKRKDPGEFCKKFIKSLLSL
ncbi:indole-3-glycerol-phosphate synthase [Blattabacterium sp. (Blattella germanica) str. Bge]|uniref:indole-3-glycerol phosphate synthase TrpC n=1 Tax=Blattabacterium sp. (Blattella germanica) TaxID=624186 RepID=UPI0001BB61E6|nr:indole-3-glycerol phosphate synthase TrpC [Blattabacterium sp. (Blattella germanica)]ACY40432.1 indole-3-glycerol-phosphate synthase [Blattabacterium sp. (Blattella germanica) str. Bge]